MIDYLAIQDNALSAIAEAGRVLPMTRKVTGAFDPVESEDTDPEEDITWDIMAVVLPATLARFRGVDNKLVESGDLVLTKARFLLAAATNPDGGTVFEPKPEDHVTFDGVTWRVIGCSPLNPAGTPLLYQIGVMI